MSEDYKGADYHLFLQYHDVEDSEIARKCYSQSRRKGKFAEVYDRHRARQNQAARGRFHAKSSAENHLNRMFVRGSAAFRLREGED